MNSRKAMDAPDFLVHKDQQTELEMAEYAAEMAIRDRDLLRKTIEKVPSDISDFFHPTPAERAIENAPPTFPGWNPIKAIEALEEASLPPDRVRVPPTPRQTQKKGNLTRCQEVLLLLSDNQWHPTSEIQGPVCGSEGLRRLRECRAAGYVIVKRRKQDSTQYEYRLTR